MSGRFRIIRENPNTTFITLAIIALVISIIAIMLAVIIPLTIPRVKIDDVNIDVEKTYSSKKIENITSKYYTKTESDTTFATKSQLENYSTTQQINNTFLTKNEYQTNRGDPWTIVKTPIDRVASEQVPFDGPRIENVPSSLSGYSGNAGILMTYGLDKSDYVQNLYEKTEQNIYVRTYNNNSYKPSTWNRYLLSKDIDTTVASMEKFNQLKEIVDNMLLNETNPDNTDNNNQETSDNVLREISMSLADEDYVDYSNMDGGSAGLMFRFNSNVRVSKLWFAPALDNNLNSSIFLCEIQRTNNNFNIINILYRHDYGVGSDKFEMQSHNIVDDNDVESSVLLRKDRVYMIYCVSCWYSKGFRNENKFLTDNSMFIQDMYPRRNEDKQIRFNIPLQRGTTSSQNVSNIAVPIVGMTMDVDVDVGFLYNGFVGAVEALDVMYEKRISEMERKIADIEEGCMIK